MARPPAPQTLVGWRERIALPELGLDRITAKIDSGARTSALHASRIKPFERDGERWVRFRVPHSGLHVTPTCEARLIDQRQITNTSGVPQERLVIETMLVLGDRRWRIEVSLADRSAMRMPLILGRTALRRRRVLVDVGRSWLTGEPRETPVKPRPDRRQAKGAKRDQTERNDR